MSLLAGIYNTDQAPLPRYVFNRFSSVITDRETDGRDIIGKGPVAFAHIMSCTTPESLLEKLPFSDEKAGFLITTDARLDNREELASCLGIATPLHQTPDSLIILEAYKEWGEDCVERLIGDFAFAIWSSRDKTIFCARDRLGIRPFYYMVSDKFFSFSSTISSLFTEGLIAKAPNLPVMQDYLLNGYISSYEETFFKDIRRLPPGCFMTVKNGSIRIQDYWQLAGLPGNNNSFEENTEQFLELFGTAVKARLRSSSFPIGFTLSGGLDSSSVFSMARKDTPDKRFDVYSFTYGHLESDETKLIEQIIAGKDILPHFIQALCIDLRGRYSFESYYRRVREWPMISNLLLRLALVDKATEDGVKVILTGEGGDETVQGNLGHVTDYFRQCRFAKVVDELGYYGSPVQTGKAVLKPLISDAMKKLRGSVKGRAERVGRGFNYSTDTIKSYAMKKNIHGIRNFDIAMRLEANYGQLSALTGIEFRHPFLDSRLVEFLLTLPGEQKLYHGVTKRILREAMKGLLPAPVRERKEKSSFFSFSSYVFENTGYDSFFSAMELSRLGLVNDGTLHYLQSGKDTASVAWVSEALKHINLELWYRSNFCKALGQGA